MSVGLVLAGPAPKQIQQALNTVATCSELTAPACLDAATVLKRADNQLFPRITARFDKMSTTGQMIAISLYAGRTCFETTTALAKVALKPKVSPAIRSLAIQTLADRFDSRRARRLVSATLITAAKDKNNTVRAAAIRLLGNRASGGDRHILTVLRRAATDQCPGVRTEAVLGLGMIAKQNVSDVLISALEDSAVRVRVAAADGLSFVKTEEAIEPLIETLRSDDPVLRRVTGEALAFQTGVRFGDDYPLWREWFINR